MKSKRIIPVFFILILSLWPVMPFVESAGYGEENENLGQFTDDFENEDNVSVAVNVINNQTLDCMELDYSAEGGLWLDTWLYRKAHTLIGTTVGPQTNYQLVIRVYYGSGIDGTESNGTDVWGKVYLNSKCQTDFDDINFTKSDGATFLDYWMEEKRDSSYAIFWVEIDTIPIYPDTVDIYIMYGNSTIVTSSNGDLTFPVFIDMEDGTLNEWDSVYGTATKTASTDHPHTGNYDAKLIPAGGSPAPSGLYKGIAAYDDGYAYRVWIYDVPTKTNLYAVAHRIHDASGNSIYLVGQSAQNEYQYWDGAGYQNTGVVRTAGFHYFEYRVNETFTYVVVDGTNARTSTRLTETALDKLNDYVYRASPNPSWFDDFIVRKWVTPEPTHGVWGSEEALEGYEVDGYFTTEDYLNYTTGQGLALLTNASVPYSTSMTVQFSNDNATWVDNEGNVGSTPVLDGFYAIDLRDLNYTDSFKRFNLTTADTAITPRLFQSRLVTTNGTAGAGPVGPGPTVIQNVTGEWIYYNLTTINVTVGTHDSGDLNSTLDIDGDTYDCSEVVGAPGYAIEFEWTNVDQDAHCLWVTAYIFYDGVSAHTINVDLWNFTSTAWVTIGIIYDMTGFEWVNSSIYDLRMPNDFINSTGAVRGRFYHVSNGNINDDIRTEFLKLYAFIPFEDGEDGVVTEQSFFWIFIAIVLSIIVGLLMWLKDEHNNN